jgi:hypothetical protein
MLFLLVTLGTRESNALRCFARQYFWPEGDNIPRSVILPVSPIVVLRNFNPRTVFKQRVTIKTFAEIVFVAVHFKTLFNFKSCTPRENIKVLPKNEN